MDEMAKKMEAMMKSLATAIATVVSQVFCQLRDDEHQTKSGGIRKGRVDVVRDIAHKAATALTGCSSLLNSGSIEVSEVQKKVVEALFPLLATTGLSQASPMPLNNKNNRNPSLSQ